MVLNGNESLPGSETERAPRLADVAKLAGVSPATASRALHGGAGREVREDNRQRVLAAAESLGYATNFAARAVAQGRTPGVSLIVGAIPADYANPLVAGVVAAVHKRKLPVTITVAPDQDALVTQVHAARGLRSETVIIAGSRDSEDRDSPALVDALTRFEAEGGRAALISQPGLPFDTVSYDNVGGGAAMATTLVELGYRRFAVMTGRGTRLTWTERVDGFLLGLQKADIELSADRVLRGEFTRDGAYAMTGELLRRDIEVDAIFGANDSIALGAMAFLRDVGRLDSIAVAGFDDLLALRDITPSLTTVHLPWDRIAEEAMRLTERPIRDTHVSKMLEGHIVVRASTPRRNA